MRTSILLLIIISLFLSCNRKEMVETNPALIIGDPFEYGAENALIFPIGTCYIAKVYESDEVDFKSNNTLYLSANTINLKDRFAKVEFINENEEDFDIRNLLFYNLKTGKSKKLVSDSIHILSFAIHREYGNPLIFYRIVKQDINMDTKYNSADPVMLFVSDLNGDNLRQITPIDQCFVDYNYYSSTNLILIKTLIDSDNDKKFSTSDETNFLEMTIDSPSFGKEIFSKSLKDSLRKQITKTNKD